MATPGCALPLVIMNFYFNLTLQNSTSNLRTHITYSCVPSTIHGSVLVVHVGSFGTHCQTSPSAISQAKLSVVALSEWLSFSTKHQILLIRL